MTNDQTLSWSRPYYWGAVYISDAECTTQSDIDFHNGEGPVLFDASGGAVLVTHADTGEDEDDEVHVNLDVQVKAQPADGMPYEAAFDVPSGRLTIGDADEWEDITLRPGRWLLQFKLDDAEQARRVEIVMSPL